MLERIGGVALKRSGYAALALATEIYDFDFASGKLATRAADVAQEFALLFDCIDFRKLKRLPDFSRKFAVEKSL